MDLKMSVTVLEHVNKKILLDVLQKKLEAAFAQTFKVTIEPEIEAQSNNTKLVSINLPKHLKISEDVERDCLLHAFAGVLYTKGVVSGKEAREITGETRREFEENLPKYGFCIMPDTEEDINCELNA